MSGCRDIRFSEMLWAYEVGMLDDDDQREFELHTLECESCRQSLKEFSEAARMIKHDPDVHQTIHRIAAEEPAPSAADQDRVSPFGLGFRRALIPATLAAAAVLLVLLFKPWQLEFRPTQEAVAEEVRLAIMYFDNLVDREDPQQLGEIAANLLITDLSESQYLQVVSGQRLYDILKLLGKEGQKRISRDIAREVADTARAELMLLGSILQTEPQLVLTAQLIEVSTGSVIAAQRVSGDTGEDIFSVIDKFTVEIKKDLSLPAGAVGEPDRPVADVTTDSPEAYRFYLQGIDDLYRYYNAEAAENFARAVEHDSTFAMAYYYLAVLTDGDLIHKAVEHLDRVGQKEKLYIKSREAAVLGNREQAIAKLEELVELYPDEKGAYYLLGQHNYSRGQYSQAVEYLDSALAIDPLYQPVFNYLTYVYDRMGEYEKAIGSINTYISLAPDEPNPYDTRGEIYAKNGKIDLAIESYRKALEKKPDFRNSIWSLGHLLFLDRQYNEARSVYRQLAESDDADLRVMSRLYLPYVPLGQGEFAQALQEFDEAIAADSAEGSINLNTGYKYFLKSRIFIELGEFDQARREFEKHLDIYRRTYPDAVVYDRQYYAQLLAESGNFAEARAVTDSLLADLRAGGYGLESYYYYGIGCIELAKGNPDSAITNLQSLGAGWEDFPSGYLLAQAYLEAGQLATAVEGYEALLARYTNWRAFWGIWNVKIHYYLGLAYEQSNWPDKAINQYETFLEIWKDADPELEVVQDAKVRLAKLRQDI